MNADEKQAIHDGSVDCADHLAQAAGKPIPETLQAIRKKVKRLEATIRQYDDAVSVLVKQVDELESLAKQLAEALRRMPFKSREQLEALAAYERGKPYHHRRYGLFDLGMHL